MRRLELDSVRGIAALIVLAYHALAINILVFSQGSQYQEIDPLWGRIISYTPLRIFWSGGEAVWIFFVLSGYVLAIAAKSTSFSWGSYFPSRLVRLYIPVVFAILLTYLSIKFFPHVLTDLNRDFLGNAAVDYSLSSVVNDFIVITGPTNTLGPLWSLRWEILFSLLLPVYLYVVSSRKNVWLVISLVCLILGFWINNEFLMYMPMFYIGVWLSTFDFQVVSEMLKLRFKTPVLNNVIGVFSLFVSVTLITSYWVWGNLYSNNPLLVLPPAVFFAIIKISGIGLLLVTVMLTPGLKSLLSQRWLVFLGTISFSLYLVHWPIVITSAFLLGPGWVSAVVGFSFSLVFAIVFYFGIEARAHKFSRKISASIKNNAHKLNQFPI